MAETKSASSRGVLRFGVFQVNLAARELRKHGVRVRLPGQPFCILSMLLEKPGEIVTREQMRRRLWASDTFVDFEHSLNSAIKKLRAALNDSPENSRYIETVPRVGYRFVAAAEVIGSAAIQEFSPEADVRPLPSPSAKPLSAVPAQKRNLYWRLGAVIVVAVIAVYGFLSPLPSPKVAAFVPGTLSDHVDGIAHLVSDGTRVYFLERHGDHDNLVQTSSAGGEAHVMEGPFRNTRIFDVSPDRSQFLIGNFVARLPEMPLWIWPVQGGSPIRVGNIFANDASWCPTGRQILYSHVRDIHIVQRDGTSDRIVVQTSGNPRWIRWSPDGSRFTFTVEDPRADAPTLWEASSDGSHAHIRFPGWTDPPSECCGEWTPDGEYFVFSSSHEGIPNLWAVREKLPFFHWTAERPVRLTATARPLGGSVLTRNGTRAFVMGWNADFDFVRYEPSSHRSLPLPHEKELLGLAYSRDGTKRVSLSGDWTLWRSNADGSQRVQLTTLPLRAAQPRWSADGSRIAFEAHLRGRPVRAYVVNAEGGPMQELFTQEGEQSGPAWSPDGETIALALNADSPAESGTPRGIYLVDWKTRQSKKVPGSEGLTTPIWSPDGKYFIAKTPEEQSVLLFNEQNQKWGAIMQGTNLSGVTWSADSKYLFAQNLVEPGQPVYRFRAGDFKRERVASFERFIEQGAQECFFQGFAPDGALLIRLRHTGGHLYAFDLDLP